MLGMHQRGRRRHAHTPLSAHWDDDDEDAKGKRRGSSSRLLWLVIAVPLVFLGAAVFVLFAVLGSPSQGRARPHDAAHATAQAPGLLLAKNRVTTPEIATRFALSGEGNDGLLVAGLPRFGSNFARDGLLSAMLVDDLELLGAQLRRCSELQGTRKDAVTGEEPGKIFHEFPGKRINKRLTTYAACDTTSLFLIGAARYVAASPQDALSRDLLPHVRRAAEYIVAHLNEDALFVESPAFSGGSAFVFSATYWKETLPFALHKDAPRFPIVYTLAHAQALAGLKAAAQVLWDSDPGQATRLEDLHKQMVAALVTLLWDEESDSLFVALQGSRPIRGASSDALHALLYLEKDEVPPSVVEGIVRASQSLETEVGYLTSRLPEGWVSAYHNNNVWPFEQALIHQAARKHGSAQMARVTERMAMLLPQLPIAPEYIQPQEQEQEQEGEAGGNAGLVGDAVQLLRLGLLAEGGPAALSPSAPERAQKGGSGRHIRLRSVATGQAFDTAGCTEQLWTRAAAVYFERVRCGGNTNPPEVRGMGSRGAGLFCEREDGSFWCLGGAQHITRSRVNDGYCDCDDGTDEPGTHACAGRGGGGVFVCETSAGGDEFAVPSSMVNDGVCDCCGRQDEWLDAARCAPNPSGCSGPPE